MKKEKTSSFLLIYIKQNEFIYILSWLKSVPAAAVTQKGFMEGKRKDQKVKRKDG